MFGNLNNFLGWFGAPTGGGGGGTVTSVGLSMPGIFTVSGSPVVASGTLTAALNAQSANLIFAGPSLGTPNTPTFRALVDADLPHTGLSTFFFANNQGIDSDGPAGTNTLNIATSNASIINIGSSGATVNIQGTTLYQNVTNLAVSDKLFTVNKGGSVGSGNSAGFEIEEGGVITGYFATNGTRDGWDFAAPAIPFVGTLDLSALTANRTAIFQNASGTIAYLSNITSAISAAISGTTNFVSKFTSASTIGNSIIFDNGASVGFGTILPTGKAHFFGMVANINQRLEPVAGVTEDISGATVNTIDATVTTIQTIAIPLNTVVTIKTTVKARKTSGTGVGVTGQGCGYERIATYQNIGGVVTIAGVVQSSYTGEAITAFDTTLTISGTNVLIRVTGALNDNVTWSCITRIY